MLTNKIVDYHYICIYTMTFRNNSYVNNIVLFLIWPALIHTIMNF